MLKALRHSPSIGANAPDKWKEFSSEEGGFIVSFPGFAEQSSVSVPRLVGEPLLHVVGYKSPTIIYAVMYTGKRYESLSLRFLNSFDLTADDGRD